MSRARSSALERRILEQDPSLLSAPPARALPKWRRMVTVLFCDVVGSTRLATELDAEAYQRLMSSYFEVASRAIEAHGGTVEKFIGDAVMALFGVPELHEDDALRAVRAAVDVRAAVSRARQARTCAFGSGSTAARWSPRLPVACVPSARP